MHRILIVGSGISGSIIARVLADFGYIVDVIEKRNHIGGNCFDYVNEHGIRIHKYGPHIFHTNDENVINYISRFTEFVEYKHKVKALLNDGRYVTLPVNIETKNIVGEENIINTFFRPYTRKMWGKEIEELNPNILKRVPIRDDMNDLYFPNDKYQYIPKYGYTKMIENILDHKNIDIRLNFSYNNDMINDYSHIFNSMPIDEFFEYEFGYLPYRSIKFHNIDIPASKLLPVACVNFTHDGPYTRMTEWKNFPNHGVNNAMTTITYEQPCDYMENNMEKYYPIHDIEGNNIAIYKKYLQNIPKNMTFIGRTGLYQYLDMDKAIKTSLEIADDYKNK